MSAGVPPPLLGRLILRLARLGDRRAEVTADLDEQFQYRVRAAGPWRARWRYLRDAASLLPPASRLPGGRLPSPGSVATGVRRDVAFALRLARRRSGSIAVTVIGLALAIGVSTAVFTLVSAVALRPAGVTSPESVVSIHFLDARGRARTWARTEWRALREQSATTAVEAIVLESIRPGSSATPGAGESVPLHVVSGGYLRTFGARPVMGRLLVEADDAPGSAPVAVVSEGFWRRRLAASPDIVGRTVDLDGTPATIVGIVQRAFSGPAPMTPGVWVPFAVGERIRPYLATRPLTRLAGRLRPEVGRAAAEAELSALVAALFSADTTPEGVPARVRLGDMDARAGEARTIGLVVLSAIVLLLLLATANMANVLLAGAAERHREIAVRLALGSGRWRLAAQLVTEGVTFSAAGAVIGLVAALWLGPFFADLLDVPPGIDVRFDARVYAFLVAAAIAVGGLAGIAPVRFSLRRDLATPMKGWIPGTAGSYRARAAFVAVQASTSMLLLIMTAILARSVVNASIVDLGFEPARTVVVRTVHPDRTCDDTCATAYQQAARDRLTGLPDVESVGVTTSAPMIGAYYPLIVSVAGGHEVFARVPVSPDYASAMTVRVARGRFFSETEVRAGERVAVVTEALARVVWPDGDALGQRLDPLGDELAGFRVVGVVSDATSGLVPRLRRVGVYVPIQDFAASTFMVRTRSLAAPVVAQVHAAVGAIDPDVRVTTQAMSDIVAEELAPIQAIAGVASTVALVALGLAVIGLYGVTAYVVGQRMHEIGVRMTLGASGPNIAALIGRQSLRPVAAGLVAGMGLAWAAGRLSDTQILGVTPTDPASYAAAAAVLGLAAAAATIAPTRRATRVDPGVVLRQQ